MKVPVLKKLQMTTNNQNWFYTSSSISFPIFIDGKTKRTSFQADVTERHLKVLDFGKKGSIRIIERSNKWYAQVAITTIDVPESADYGVLGVDLGLKVPAVSYSKDTHKTKFYGNGRKNKYMKRRINEQRKSLQKSKKKTKRIDEKEQRYMKDQDHKVSRQIVNEAIEQGCGTIKLELLANIRKTARTSRKNARNLHTWSFYRLSQFIEYKARLVGIKVEYVDPSYTSQTCPSCNERNKAKDRLYSCACGYTKHRDVVGAINIGLKSA